jgi:GNAT superfamily N-acetyltransferase
MNDRHVKYTTSLRTPTAAAAVRDVVVRQAVLSDLEVVAVLFDRYRQFQGRPADLDGAREFLRARFDHGESIVFVATDAERPLGFAQLYPSFSSVSLQRVFVLNDRFVAEEGRRRGVATLLLNALESHAWSLGAARITLNVARPNTTAQALYDASGWQQDDQFFMYHRYPPADAR